MPLKRDDAVTEYPRDILEGEDLGLVVVGITKQKTRFGESRLLNAITVHENGEEEKFAIWERADLKVLFNHARCGDFVSIEFIEKSEDGNVFDWELYQRSKKETPEWADKALTDLSDRVYDTTPRRGRKTGKSKTAAEAKAKKAAAKK